jgi:hypothetical protein
VVTLVNYMILPTEGIPVLLDHPVSPVISPDTDKGDWFAIHEVI